MLDLIERLVAPLEGDPLVHRFEAAFRSYADLLMNEMRLETVIKFGSSSCWSQRLDYL
jgi:hypothetical protein